MDELANDVINALRDSRLREFTRRQVQNIHSMNPQVNTLVRVPARMFYEEMQDQDQREIDHRRIINKQKEDEYQEGLPDHYRHDILKKPYSDVTRYFIQLRYDYRIKLEYCHDFYFNKNELFTPLIQIRRGSFELSFVQWDVHFTKIYPHWKTLKVIDYILYCLVRISKHAKHCKQFIDDVKYYPGIIKTMNLCRREETLLRLERRNQATTNPYFSLKDVYLKLKQAAQDEIYLRIVAQHTQMNEVIINIIRKYLI